MKGNVFRYLMGFVIGGLFVIAETPTHKAPYPVLAYARSGVCQNVIVQRYNESYVQLIARTKEPSTCVILGEWWQEAYEFGLWATDWGKQLPPGTWLIGGKMGRSVSGDFDYD